MARQFSWNASQINRKTKKATYAVSQNVAPQRNVKLLGKFLKNHKKMHAFAKKKYISETESFQSQLHQGIQRILLYKIICKLYV